MPKPQPPVAMMSRLSRFVPFSSAPPVAMNYFMFLVSMVAFAVVVYLRRSSASVFVAFAAASLAVMLGSNFMLHCMIFGNCMRFSMLFVALLQIANILIFLMLPPRF